MLYTIVQSYPHPLFKKESNAKVSLYLPTHRAANKNEEDKIRFSNLIKQIETPLSQTTDKATAKAIIHRLKTMKDDRTLWNQRLHGMAIFSDHEESIVYILQNQPREIALVGQRFHTKPLVRDFQGLDEYQVLTLDRQRFDVYEGNRTGFRKIPHGDNEPITIQDFLGDEYTEGYLSQGSYGGAANTPMFHGHKSRKDEVDKDIERYLKLVDKHVLEHYSNKSKKPLILFALPEYHEPFIKMSKNPHLIHDGIKRSPKELKESDIKAYAWNIIEPRYQKGIETLKDNFNQAYQKSMADDQVHALAKASVSGRIQTLLIEAYRTVPGRIDEKNGTLIHRDKQQAKYDDALDDLMDLVIQNGGAVHVIPSHFMPSDTGVAGIYRF